MAEICPRFLYSYDYKHRILVPIPITRFTVKLGEGKTADIKSYISVEYINTGKKDNDKRWIFDREA